MLKKKLNDIIYSDYLTPDEKEMYCYYYKGDRYDYGTYVAGWEFNSPYEEKECYRERLEQLKDNIKASISFLNLPVSDEKGKLAKAILKYLETIKI